MVVPPDQPPLEELKETAGLVSVVTEGLIQLPRRQAQRGPALAAEDREGLETLTLAQTVARQFNM